MRRQLAIEAGWRSDFGRLGDEDLALSDGGGAGGLQLGDFLLAHDAHAAGSLKREAGIVTKGRNLPRPCGRRQCGRAAPRVR